LIVVGSDFYLGSAREAGKLKDGWCDFRALGANYARQYFGTSQALENVWYFATKVSPFASRSFEEHERQRIWLAALQPSVTRMITDAAPTVPLLGGSGQGGEFSYLTEDAAISALQPRLLAPQVLVISAGDEKRTRLSSFLSENYNREQIILVPPDFEMRDDGRGYSVHLSHEDLEAARLAKEGLWSSYERSKRRSDLAAKWLEIAFAELGIGLTRRLQSLPFRHPDHWEKRVQADANIRDYLRDRVARLLTAYAAEDTRLATERNLVFFIAKKILEENIGAFLAERIGGVGLQPRFSIRNGRDLIDQASKAYPALEICERAERQILDLTGNEKFFGWLIEAFSSATCAMQDWVSGPFPHEQLPDSAITESLTVRANSKLRNMRTFKTRRGESLQFLAHMKNKAENIRVHYRVDEDRRVLMIGYVGPHLPLHPV